MKQTLRLLLGITAFTIAGIIIYRKRNRTAINMLRSVSDEGYETAQDILYPKKSKKFRGLHYGPVLPR